MALVGYKARIGSRRRDAGHSQMSVGFYGSGFLCQITYRGSVEHCLQCSCLYCLIWRARGITFGGINGLLSDLDLIYLCWIVLHSGLGLQREIGQSYEAFTRGFRQAGIMAYGLRMESPHLSFCLLVGFYEGKKTSWILSRFTLNT